MFHFPAYWLEADDPAGLIGITIGHEEPLPVAIMRRMRDLPLSRRRAEVCFLLANGFTYERIAQELGISKHTVIAHGRWIYNKLDIHNREELTARLLPISGRWRCSRTPHGMRPSELAKRRTCSPSPKPILRSLGKAFRTLLRG